MTIKVWRDPSWPAYIVQVGASVWEMSSNADATNGVCIYVGNSKTVSPDLEIAAPLVNTLPIGVVRAIVRKVQIEDGAITA